MKDSAPERGVTEDAHDKAADIEKRATVKLLKIQPTTIAGVMAVTAYFAEHLDRYPDCGWIERARSRMMIPAGSGTA